MTTAQFGRRFGRFGTVWKTSSKFKPGDGVVVLNDLGDLGVSFRPPVAPVRARPRTPAGAGTTPLYAKPPKSPKSSLTPEPSVGFELEGTFQTGPNAVQNTPNSVGRGDRA